MLCGMQHFYDEYSQLDWAKIPFELDSKITIKPEHSHADAAPPCR